MRSVGSDLICHSIAAVIIVAAKEMRAMRVETEGEGQKRECAGTSERRVLIGINSG